MPLPLTLDPALDAADPARRLHEQGFALLPRQALASVAGCAPQDFDALAPYWERLPPDAYLRDGGRYRFRRHASLVQEFEPPALTLVPHRAHWQPTTYNALHGGIERWFEPVEPGLHTQPAWNPLLQGLGRLFADASARRNGGRAPERWFIEAHTFRIDTREGVGRPTPEGAHRDGVDYVAVLLVDRHRVRGGETRVFEADGPRGLRFTLAEHWSALLLDDARVIHETTPIQPDGDDAHRDTLVLTFRQGGFQDPQ
ncbi:2OG-Fe dioxygenase family protein [Caldimonas tepidiphila]|uniref:2OG-Fe dioxygenase family protein n=1 Tax=Caldimonas tepidiphila TaxID=2315841 RepID=UPI000E5AC3EE|nr:2OG-Fe dioxygenase family protein [Caldimonas tepidiphila]